MSTPSTSALADDPEDDDPPVRPPDGALLTPPFVRLLATQAAFGFSFSVFLLLPQVLAASFGSTPAAIGLVMAAFGAASVLAIPFVGRVVDRLGHRRTLVL